MTKFTPATAQSGTLAAAPAFPSGLTIDASVPNCDIVVDGTFMGSTPSTLTLAAGKHDVVIKKSGYKDWTRSMAVGSGSVRLNAEMLVQ